MTRMTRMTQIKRMLRILILTFLSRIEYYIKGIIHSFKAINHENAIAAIIIWYLPGTNEQFDYGY